MSDTDFNLSIRGLNRFTINARKVISQGYTTAREYLYDEYKIIHLFHALILDKNGISADIFNRVGVDIETTIKQIEQEFNNNKLANPLRDPTREIKFSEEVKNLINGSFVVASELSSVYVGAEHLLLSMFKLTDVEFIEEMKKIGINYEVLQKTLSAVSNYSGFNSILQPDKDLNSELGKQPSTLQYFSRNMNDIALNNEYMNITGRDEEIKRMINILARKTKNNPILVGDAGVGKTKLDDTYAIKNSKKFSNQGAIGGLPNGTPVKFRTYLEQLLEASDNNAWFMLVDYLGGDNYGIVNPRIINELQINPLFLDPPTGTAAMVGKALDEMYSATNISRSSADYLISLMESALPWARAGIGLGLPTGTRYANKIGTLQDSGKVAYEDGALVWTPKTDYSLVIMDENTGWGEGQVMIQKLSTIVYNYINK